MRAIRGISKNREYAERQQQESMKQNGTGMYETKTMRNHVTKPMFTNDKPEPCREGRKGRCVMVVAESQAGGR